jgi:nifR3 family TIM-barrel protein
MIQGNEKKPVGVQLFGRDPAMLADIAKRICGENKGGISEININMGCPAPKIVKNGEGCALMNDMALSSSIISSVKKSIDIPLSVKIRKGFDGGSVNAVEFAVMAEGSGADIIAVHGRTREQYYSGKADRSVIRAVKEATSIKVIGNGDIFCAQDAKDMVEETGCDAVMIGRGAVGNPFLFAQVRELLYDGEVSTYPSGRQRIDMMLRHAGLAVDIMGEHIAMLRLRSHTPHYTKGMKNSARLRDMLVKVDSYSMLEKVVEDWYRETEKA